MSAEFHESTKMEARHLPAALKIASRFFSKTAISTVGLAEDFELGWDIRIGDDEGMAFRIRSNDAFIKWPEDITIRTDRPSGKMTEMDKFKRHLTDFFFYGFESKDETRIVDYVILRLTNTDWDTLRCYGTIWNSDSKGSEGKIYKRYQFEILDKGSNPCFECSKDTKPGAGTIRGGLLYHNTCLGGSVAPESVRPPIPAQMVEEKALVSLGTLAAGFVASIEDKFPQYRDLLKANPGVLNHRNRPGAGPCTDEEWLAAVADARRNNAGGWK
jgi:hypothetical protein